MSTTLPEAFNAGAGDYDRLRRRLLPCFDGFYGAALAALPFEREAADGPRILDLGAGTGLLTAIVAAALPRARFVLVDVAAEMLAGARRRFAADGERFEFIVADYGREMPDGPFDAVISALSIHHLEDDAKARLFHKVRQALAPGGVFVNAEQVAAETDAESRGIEAAWERAVLAAGVTAAELAAARARMAHDRPATVGDQLGWMAAAGFRDGACVFRDGMFAVMSARR